MPPPNNNQAATTDYNQAVAEFGSVYDPQIAAVHAQADQALQAKNTALSQYAQDNATKLSQLDQAKTNAFSNNALTANARGIMYSGYTPAQNTAYTTNTYNPNVQAANTAYQRNVDTTNTNYAANYKSLEDKINQLNQQRANDAYSLVQGTKQAQAQAAKEAANAAKSSTALPSESQVRLAIRQGLTAKGIRGSDGYVAPQDYATALGDWLSAGLSRSSFNNNFKDLRNPNNSYYDYAIKQAGL